jgi:hypothetical protein
VKFWRAKQLTSRKFKRLTGVSRQTFELIVSLVKADEQNKNKPGRPPKLIIEDQVLMVIQYWREYRTYYHIRLFKNSGIKFGELLKVIADKGYQGINKIHQLSETPIKKPKGTGQTHQNGI